MRRIILIVLALVLVVSVRTSAQLPTAQKWTDVEWYSLINWQFTAAAVDTAMTLFFGTGLPALKESFPGIRCFRHVTGEWHVTCIAPMPEGPSWLEWEMPPEFVDYITRIFEREGEAAMDIAETFNNAVARQTLTIVLEPTGGM